MTEPDRVPGPPGLHPATLLLRELMQINSELERRHADSLDVNGIDYRAMGVLIGLGPVPAGRLAQELGISPSAASNVIDRLIEVGHAERHRDSADGRRMIISAVPESRERAMGTVRGIIGRSEAVARSLSADQQDALISFLSQMTDAMRTVLADMTSERTPPDA